MKKLNVIVKDKNTLVLNEDGSKGDIIDLLDLKSIDSSNIESLINDKDEKKRNLFNTPKSQIFG